MTEALLWFKANGKMHQLKTEEPLTGQCGVKPLLDEAPAFVPYDPIHEVPSDPCRACLMVVAISDDVVDSEPMDVAISRGVLPVEAPQLRDRGVEVD